MRSISTATALAVLFSSAVLSATAAGSASAASAVVASPGGIVADGALQVYTGGKWRSAASQYFPLGTTGKSAVRLGAPGQSGIKARMRSVYVDGSSGDNVNTTTYGSWKYLYFSK